MVKPICRLGNPVLREEAKLVPLDFIKTDDFNQLIADLYDSMKHYGGIGIAAPQIGVSLQVALIQLEGVNRYDELIDLPLTTFINPQVEILGTETQSFWEGCLSVPGLRGLVERPNHVRVKYVDKKGEEKFLEAKGFLATVLQHELDHLFGVLYVDRIKDTKNLSYQEEYESFIVNKES